MDKELRIIYMGTPEFAVEPLRAILEAGYTIVAVITAPDKPAGRGQKMQISPVKEFGLNHNLKILQPVNLKDTAFVAELKNLNANLMVVVAFRMLPDVVWQLPEYGTLNLHASLLPDYRGAAPINHAIINGETETGLTTFFIEREIDTGNIIHSRKLPILPSDDAGVLHDRLMAAGGDVMLETLKMLETGTAKVQSQDSFIAKKAILHPAPKIFRNDCRINWTDTGLHIHNLIRGLSPFPGAFSNLISGNGEIKQVKLYRTTFEANTNQQAPGTIITDDKISLSVQCADGMIHLEELQMEGKKRMTAAEFLRGMQSLSRYRFES